MLVYERSSTVADGGMEKKDTLAGNEPCIGLPANANDVRRQNNEDDTAEPIQSNIATCRLPEMLLKDKSSHSTAESIQMSSAPV